MEITAEIDKVVIKSQQCSMVTSILIVRQHPHSPRKLGAQQAQIRKLNKKDAFCGFCYLR